ncbi:MAG: hypothetical protein R3C52_05300 [Hyphomonadaceae bacterium]
MNPYEQLARRYCALLGEDPEERINGVQVWRVALADLEAAMNALDTYGLDVRETFHKLAEATLPEQPPETDPAPRIRRVA